MIEKYQRKEKELVARLKRTNYYTKYICGGLIVTQLVYRSDKIVVIVVVDSNHQCGRFVKIMIW